MQITIFGPLRVRTEDAVLGSADFGGVKPRELLALLLLARGQPVSKETLAEHLWPQQAPKNVAGTLETYVSVLRKKLFADRARAKQVLVTNAGAYRFATDQVSLDIDLFDDLVARADMPGNDQLQLRLEAAALATGELLTDFRTAAWAHSERELYCDRITRVHVLVAEELLGSSAFTGAITHAEAALRFRPYAEEAYRILMLANHALGHSESARQAFERCRTILSDELGHDPLTETAQLAAAIDAGAPAEELLNARRDVPVTVAARPASRSADRRDPTGRLPFIGRQRELDLIRSHISASRSGDLRLVLVRGRPGIGRTALIEHLYASVTGLVGCERYSPHDLELPPLPLSRGIAHALADRVGAIEAERYANAPLLSESPRALSTLRTLLADHAPMVLLLDDMQWADNATISALRWLRREGAHLPVTIVATARDGVFDRTRHLDLLDPSQVIRLSPLSLQEPPDRWGIDAEIVQATGGVPRLLADHWRWRTAGGSGPSPSLREAVLRATRGLGGIHPALLQAVCQLPEPFEPLQLEGAIPLPPGEVAAALDHLCDLGYLDRVEGTYRFQAPIVRDVIASTVQESRQAHPTARKSRTVQRPQRTFWSPVSGRRL